MSSTTGEGGSASVVLRRMPNWERATITTTTGGYSAASRLAAGLVNPHQKNGGDCGLFTSPTNLKKLQDGDHDPVPGTGYSCGDRSPVGAGHASACGVVVKVAAADTWWPVGRTLSLPFECRAFWAAVAKVSARGCGSAVCLGAFLEKLSRELVHLLKALALACGSAGVSSSVWATKSDPGGD